LLASLGVLALIRYRAMIPFMYVLFLVEYLGKKWILLAQPILRTGPSPGTYVNLVLIVLLIAGLLMSLRSRSSDRANAQ
jgi:hypothetical protein